MDGARMCRWRELNPRPLAYEATALPLSYNGKSCFLSERVLGRGNRTCSLAPGRIRTEDAPNALIAVRSFWTNDSGADAPAVTPIRECVFNHSGFKSSAPSIKYASAPYFSATSLSLLLFELVGLPTTSTRSTSEAKSFTASCLFCVA